MSDAKSVATRLGDPEREGSSWRCRCPVHGGRSLILSDARNGSLLWNCKAGCGQKEVMQALLDRGLLEREEPSYYLPPPRVAERDDREKLTYALKVWNEARSTRGTLAEKYLRARGYEGPPRESLRYHPDLWHAPSRMAWPALVAKVVDLDGEM